jgi:hypothetical protein
MNEIWSAAATSWMNNRPRFVFHLRIIRLV